MSLVSKSAEYYSAFDPRMIPGCVMWLDGTDSRTITGTTQVTRWLDKTSNAYAFTRKSTGFPVVSNMEPSGLNGLYIGSNAALVNSNIPVPTDYSMFAVANRTTSNGAYGYIAKINTAGDFYGFFGCDPQSSFATFGGTNTAWRDVNCNTPRRLVGNTPVLMSMDVSGASLIPYWNGEAMTAKVGSVTATTGMTIGDAATTTFGQPWLGIIGEVLLYSNVLTPTQRQQVEGYLTWKWRLRRTDSIATWATGSSPSTFNPTSVTGIALWLDASDTSTLTLSGSNVTGWTDKSGLGRTVSFISGNPTYDRLTRSVVTNLTSIQAANVDTRKTTTTYLNVFIVYRWLEGGSNCQLRDTALWGNDQGGGWNRLQLLGYGSATQISFGLGRSSTAPNIIPCSGLDTNTQVLYSCRYASNIANGTFVRVNGYQVSLSNYTEGAASPQTSSTNINFGAIDDSNRAAGRFAFNEMIVYRSDITATDRTNIETYLAYKWNIPWLSPITPTQPYYNDVIFQQPIFPNDVPAPEFWFDAADRTTITATGTTFTSAVNKGTAQGSNLTVSTGTPTIGTSRQNGLPVISMSTSGDSLVFNGTFPTQARTRFFALKPLVNTSNAVAMIWLYQNLANSAGNDIILWNSAQLTENANGVINNLLSAVAAQQSNVFGVWTIRNATTTAANRMASNANALSLVTSAVAGSYNTAASAWYFNRREAGQAYSGAFELAEFLSYNSQLTSNQTEQIEGYLAWKWGTQASLPSTHAFRSLYPLTGQFTPGQAPGLVLWLDAEDPTTFELSGNVIRRWKDKSGAGQYSGSPAQYDASAIGVCRLSNDVYGKLPAVRFTGSNWFVGSTSITGTTLSAFAVASTDISSAAVDQRIVSVAPAATIDSGSASAAAALFFQGSVSNVLNTFRNGTRVSVSSRTNSALLGEAIYDGTNANLYIDASLGNTAASTGTFASTVYGIGNQASPTTESLTGYIGEVLVFSNALPTLDRYRVEGYLAWKWSLQSRLPSWHPYKSVMP